MNASTSPGLRHCPRCGYDQSGAFERWVSECPVKGTCTECGLDFHWRDIFFPPNRSLRQWPECTRRRWLVPLAGLAAPFLAMAPWLLFRRLTMSDPLRWTRLVFVAMEWIVVSLCIAIVWFWCYVGSNAGLGWSRVLADWPHLLRLPVESLWVPRWHWGPLPHPNYEWAMFQWDAEVTAVWPGWRFAGTLVAMTALSAAAFAFLPIARRRAKVRTEHLVRALAVLLASATIMVPVLSFGLGWVTSGRIYWSSLTHLIDSRWTLPYTGAVFAWLVVWWHAIASIYLRMARPWAVALSVSSVGMIAAWLGVAVLAIVLH